MSLLVGPFSLRPSIVRLESNGTAAVCGVQEHTLHIWCAQQKVVQRPWTKTTLTAWCACRPLAEGLGWGGKGSRYDGCLWYLAFWWVVFLATRKRQAQESLDFCIITIFLVLDRYVQTVRSCQTVRDTKNLLSNNWSRNSASNDQIRWERRGENFKPILKWK